MGPFDDQVAVAVVVVEGAYLLGDHGLAGGYELRPYPSCRATVTSETAVSNRG